MAVVNVVPTRQELLRLKTKRKSVKRGHKLLKDKRDNLIQIFMQCFKEARDLRKEIDEKFNGITNRMNLAILVFNEDYLALLAENPGSKIRIFSESTNVLGIKIPKLDVKLSGEFLNYSLLMTNYHLDVSVKTLQELMPVLMKLLELEYKVKKLAGEIEKTRRRVNALEFVILPEIDVNVKYIENKLAEDALQTTVRLMRMKATLAN